MLNAPATRDNTPSHGASAIDCWGCRYGTAGSVEDYSFKSQLMAYEGVRAMFEAFSRNKYTSTGVIQCMLNNAWLGLIWHLYDYYVLPGGGYFETKKACTDGSISVVNSQYRDVKGLKLMARVLNLDMTEKFSREAAFDLPSDGAKYLFTLPEIKNLSPVYFLKLGLKIRQAGSPARTSTGSPPSQKHWIMRIGVVFYSGCLLRRFHGTLAVAQGEDSGDKTHKS